jgi:hypothetical protein
MRRGEGKMKRDMREEKRRRRREEEEERREEGKETGKGNEKEKKRIHEDFTAQWI